MKRFILSFCTFLCTIFAYAIIANPEPATIIQPDGSALEITLHGDEYLSVTTTSDGYSVVRDTDGFMKYAIVKDDRLVPSHVIAHDPKSRKVAEIDFLHTINPYLIAEPMREAAIMARQQKSLTSTAPAAATAAAASGYYDYSKFRGLVILVEFNDCKFSRDDIATIFTDMVSKQNYTGFKTLSGNMIDYTGSVRDYFYSNSMGRFDPHFDVVGPVTIDYSQTYPCAAENNHIIIPAALNAADPLVDYSLYDTDGDGVTEMIYFIFAGAGSNYAGNNSRYLWPHAAQVGSSMSLDGVKFKRYACSTEFYGLEVNRIIDGIGTICHEFSHVLGLNDLYDTDYSTNGLSVSPEDWSLMAGGSYLNFARTPCCMSLYERYAIGFASPQLITQEGAYSIQTIGQSNSGYRINSGMDKEFFLIENRQNTGWDKHLPGHGMLVFRVDSTDVSLWDKNKVNAYAAHPCYELLRANPQFNNKGTIVDGVGDPFPGSSNVCEITNTTAPSLRSWTGLETDMIITDIAEHSDGTVTFATKSDAPDVAVEDFETCPVTTGSPADVTGRFCSWTLENGAGIAAYSDTGTDRQSASMIMGASITTGSIAKEVDFITADFFNPTYYASAFRCQYSTDNGASWQNINTIDGDDQVRLASKTHSHVLFKAATAANCRYRFVEEIGNRTSYIDNISFLFTKHATSATPEIDFDNDSDRFTATLCGDILTVNCLDNMPVIIYTIEGRHVTTLQPVGNSACFTLPAHGLYILRHGSCAVKMLY